MLTQRGILVFLGACGACACGDGPAVSAEPPSWVGSAGSSATAPWLAKNSLASAWEYDSSGNSKREGKGSTRDDLFGGETGSTGAGGTGAGGGAVSPGGGSAGSGVVGGGGLNLVAGCNVVQELAGESV